MRKILLSLVLASSVMISADVPVKLAANDCIESLQNEVIGIIYSNSIKKDKSIEQLTEKINKTFEKDCDVNSTENKEQRKAKLLEEEKANATVEHVLILDTTKNSDDCIETLQSEISKIVHSNKENKNKAIKLIIKGDADNCTKEPVKK
ncbi:MAG: hypothetical protein PHR87_02305 [Sulfurospirillaceae bacterium]|nr:hypothetical protein [Sulfurospirillaceae bacterium]